MVLSKPRVLLADDEKGLRELVRVYLENTGFEVIEAANGLEAETELNKGTFDLAIIDVMMPKLDGLTLCRKIRRGFENLPIMLLTAKGEEVDKLLGFEYGADDYVVKPFSPRELAARAKALLRRSVKFQKTNEGPIHYPNLLIDETRHHVEWFNQEIVLTPKEFSLLCLLAKTPRQVYSRGQIMSLAWGEDYLAELRIVDVHVKNLREKFNAIEPFDYLQTVWGIGYKFEVGR